MITLTAEEIALADRLSVPDGWDHQDAAGLKAKIRPYLIARTSMRCCYCLTSMHGWHPLTIDPEHILPKGKYPEYTFAIANLSISCKRCNMGIKRDDTSFYSAPWGSFPFVSLYYTIIHPNLDDADAHLLIADVHIGTKQLIKYQVVNNSSKGQATYRYFKLRDIEMNTFDEAQGLAVVSPNFAEDLVKSLDEIMDQ